MFNPRHSLPATTEGQLRRFEECAFSRHYPFLNKAEHSQGINVITQRDTVGKHYPLASFDVGPGGFLFKGVSIDDFPAKIVQ